jgi:hypothetical protein
MLHVRRVAAFLVVGLVIAGGSSCGSSPASPSDDPPSADAPLPDRALVLNGRVVGTVTGQPVPNATVTVGGQTRTTADDGTFSLAFDSTGTRDLTIEGEGLIARVSRLSVRSREVTLDIIQNRAPFELDFFREFARNGLETESGLEPLRPVSAAPRVHLRTMDESGRPMDEALLDLIESAIRDSTEALAGGRFPIEIVERGPDTKQGQTGWVTVLFPGESAGGGCGTANVGTTTGRIELNYRNAACGCDGRAIAPRTVRHELGHVYGYWHTSARGGVMARYWTTRQCDIRPSPREAAHAKYVYARLAGNMDPDTDAAGQVLRQPGDVLIQD